MSDDRSSLVAELFDKAVESDTAQQQALLDERCGSDVELRREVESLLRAARKADGFLESAVIGNVATGAFSAGDVIGSYEIMSLLGKGGMGEVYLAHDRRVRRQVALKLVRGGLDRAARARRFQREQEMLAGLNHPNIAQLYETGVTEEGIPYFAMEYVEGTRLDRFVDERGLGLKERLFLFRQLCSAVAYAHQSLVIHRDIKPANIRVTPAGEPKLLDFGIAKLFDEMAADSTEQTVTMERMLTPEYASPEQIRGEQINTAADVYSLGVVLYELLTGTKPYRLTNRHPADLTRAITDQAPVRPSENRNSKVENRKSLRGDLDNIVLMAMRKEPERRYPSAAHLGADIDRHLQGLPVAARKDTVGYRSSKFIRRHRLAVAASALVLLSIMAGLIIALWEARQARAQRDLARHERFKAERINQFLQTMLSFSNQSVTSVSPVANRKEVTVNEMLDQIAPRIDTELADEPDVRAQVLRTLGSAYASQGLFDQAEKNFRAALGTQRELHGEENAETAATMLELGVLSYRQVKLDEASRLLEQAVAFYRSRRNTSDGSAAKLAMALQYLGDVRGVQGDVKGCLSLLNEAVEISSRANLQGTERAVATMNKSDLGCALAVFGEVDKAATLLREAITEYHQMSSEEPWELGVSVMMLGVTELNQNQIEEAQKHLVESERILRKTLGDRNVYLATNLDREAAALFRRDELKAAEEKARHSLVIGRAVSGSNQLAVATSLWTLGDILVKGGRAAEGADCYRQAVDMLEHQTVPNYLYIVSLKLRLSQALLAEERSDEAEKVAVAAREAAKQHLGEQNAVTRAATETLRRIYEKQGRQDEAQGLK